MSDFSKRKGDTPVWARDLTEGDIISADQARGVCATRLRDFGLESVPMRNGKFRIERLNRAFDA
jgi:hypothetical protein